MDALARVDSPSAAVLLAVESWEAFWPDAKPLMLAHKQELKQEDPREPLIPDHQQINRLEALGGLMIVTARRSSSALLPRLAPELLGYLIWYLAPSLETIGVRTGLMGPWYVAPEARRSGLGLALWWESKRELRSREVSLVHAHFPSTGPGADLGKFFFRLGAQVIGTEVKLWIKD